MHKVENSERPDTVKAIDTFFLDELENLSKHLLLKEMKIKMNEWKDRSDLPKDLKIKIDGWLDRI